MRVAPGTGRRSVFWVFFSVKTHAAETYVVEKLKRVI